MYHGDIRLGDTIDIKFCTVTTTGAPTTLAGSPVISAYPGNSTTELTGGITLSVDFDSRTGLNNARVVASSGNGYATATNYMLVITTGTVGGTSVVGYCIGSFSIEARSALMPTTAARTLVVDASGLADSNAVKLGPTGSGTAQTARDIGASVLLSAGTGTGQLDFTSGVVKANLAQILGTALTETAGLIAAGFKKFFNVASPTGTVNSLADAVPGAAGGGFIAGTNAATTVTTALTTTFTGNLTGSVASVTGAVGSVTGAVGSVGTGGITAASIAADAIGASELAADAVTEIRSLASGTSDSGTTTTMVDAARTEADTDYWKGSIIVFTSGNIAGQARLITGFNAATDTITYAPATTQAADTQTYEIWPAGRADLGLIAGAAISTSSAQLGVNTVQAGATAWGSGAITAATFAADAITAAKIADGAIDAATFAAGAIDAAAIASNAITAAKIATDAITAAKVADGTIDAATFATGAITAAAIAADAIGASELAADAVAEIADAVWDEVLSEHLTSGTTGAALNGAGAAGDPWGTALPGAYGAGTAGKIIGDNIDAAISSRASQTSVDTVDDFLDTEIADIRNRLPAALVSGRIDSSVGAMASAVLTAAAIATDAITAAKIAADAIGASELAADAVTEIQSGLSTLTAAQVNAEVVDALNVDTYAEPSAVPAATVTLAAKIGWLFALARNKLVQSATTQTLRNDADSSDIATAAVSDSGTEATRDEWS